MAKPLRLSLGEMIKMTKKILSIAPSFDCSLSCEGCYLTSDVTQEMKDLVKGEEYFMRVIEEAKVAGYTEFAITWNPFPGAFETTKKYIMKAKELGLETSVTTVLQCLSQIDEEFAKRMDTITVSVDDMRFKSMTDFQEKNWAIMHSLELKSIPTAHIAFNYNLLWTPTVFQWLYQDTANFERALDSIRYPHTVQHLIYKPLSIYESEEWFWENYRTVYSDYPWVDISGTRNPTKFIGDIALGNMLGLNKCPGQEYQMLDVDPMGFVRRCPENPTAYSGDTISDVSSYLMEGSPCRKEKCNCITG